MGDKVVLKAGHMREQQHQHHEYRLAELKLLNLSEESNKNNDYESSFAYMNESERDVGASSKTWYHEAERREMQDSINNTRDLLEALESMPLVKERPPGQDPGPEWESDSQEEGVYNLKKEYHHKFKNRVPTVTEMESRKPIRLLRNGQPIVGAQGCPLYALPIPNPAMATANTLRINGEPVSIHCDPSRLAKRQWTNAEEDSKFEITKREQRAIELIHAYNKIHELGRLDSPAYNLLIHGFSHIKSWRMALHLYTEMTAKSIKHDAASLRGLLYGFHQSKQWQKAMTHLLLARQEGVKIYNHHVHFVLTGAASSVAYDPIIYLLGMIDDPCNDVKAVYDREDKERCKRHRARRLNDLPSDSISDCNRTIWLVEDLVFGRKLYDDKIEQFRTDVDWAQVCAEDGGDPRFCDTLVPMKKQMFDYNDDKQDFDSDEVQRVNVEAEKESTDKENPKIPKKPKCPYYEALPSEEFWETPDTEDLREEGIFKESREPDPYDEILQPPEPIEDAEADIWTKPSDLQV